MASNNTTEHEFGTMNIREQQRTFTGFVRFISWTGVLAILAVVLAALSNA